MPNPTLAQIRERAARLYLEVGGPEEEVDLSALTKSTGATRLARTCVSPNLLNLSMSRPEQLPIATTLGASSSAGIAITHSSFARREAKL